MNYHVLLLFLIANPFINVANASDAATLLAFARGVLNGVKEVMKEENERLLLAKIAELNTRVKNMDRNMQSTALATISSIKDYLSQTIRFEHQVNSLYNLVSMIKFADEEYTEIIKACSISMDNKSNCTLERHTIETFATSALSRSPNSVWNTMDQLHSVIEPDQTARDILQRQNIYKLFSKVLKAGEGSMCHQKQSPTETINRLFNYLQMIQLKGFTMIQFSWKLLKVFNKGGNFTTESRIMRERYISRMIDQANSFTEAYELADSSYSRCDPEHHVEGETYLQLTRLLQGYVIYEENLVDGNVRHCQYTCPYYQNTEPNACSEDGFCSGHTQCYGELRDCRYLSYEMTVCHADPTTTDSRRYEWIETDDGEKLGHAERSCYKKSSVTTEPYNLFWRCDYCFCLCDDTRTWKSHRYFSLRDVVSSTIHNKVITGIKLVKNNRIIHMQIQEAKLEQLGQVQESSTTWQPVDDFEVTNAIEGRDYMKMSYSQRVLALDDLAAPTGHVITGVRFLMKYSRLKFEIRASPFNITTGKLDENSFWIGNSMGENERTELILESPDIPTNTIFPSVIDSKRNQFLYFTHSDVKKDVAQTTVPFLDAQEVAPQPPMPLSGIGIYHKGQSGFGGFVGLKVNVFKRDARSQIEQEISNFSL